MARLILQMQSTIDGKVSATDPEFAWNLWNWVPPAPWDTRLLATFNSTLASIDHVLLSRPMFEGGYLDHWTRVAQDHGDHPAYAFSQRIVDAEKVVVTSKPVAFAGERVTVRVGELSAAVNQVKEESSKGVIVFGGTTFARALLNAGLVDELQLYINPAAVGQGDSIMSTTKRFELLDTTAYDSGMVVTRYAPTS